MHTWFFVMSSVVGCSIQGTKPLQCVTDRTLADVDRDGDGVLTAEDLDPGEAAVAVLLEDLETGEVLGTLHSRSVTDVMVHSPGTAPARPWMGKYDLLPSWSVLHDPERGLCNAEPIIQTILRRTDDPGGRLVLGPVDEGSWNVSIDESSTEEWSFEGGMTITAITDQTVSGQFDGVAMGVLHDPFDNRPTNTQVTIQGFAWNAIPGEHLEP